MYRKKNTNDKHTTHTRLNQLDKRQQFSFADTVASRRPRISGFPGALPAQQREISVNPREGVITQF